jgi:hypothetical protein
MDGLELLREARAAGLVVLAEGDRLRIRGPRQAEPVARRLLQHKGLVLNALVSGLVVLHVGDPDDLPGDWRVQWEERAAILEYDGGLPRERAEATALAEIIRLMRETPARTPCSCRSCAGE